jgi:hypothetical protein
MRPAGARREAWEHAEFLAQQDAAHRAATIKIIDRKVAFLGKGIAHPGFLLGSGLRIIKHTESNDVAAIIGALATIEAA